MADIRVNIDPSPKTIDVPEDQPANTDDSAVQDVYVAGKVEQAPEFSPDFAQGARQFVAELPKKPRSSRLKENKSNADRVQQPPKEINVRKRNAYPTPLSESCPKDGYYKCEEMAAVYVTMMTERFKEANLLDAQIKAAIKRYELAETTKEIKSAISEMFDVSDRADDFLEKLNSDAIHSRPYTYSTQFKQMFIGTVNSIGELRQLLRPQ